MIILPAIDLMGGRVVRLRQGRKEDVTVYDENPGRVARLWAEGGAGWIHVVDLDGAFEGGPRNLEAINAITASCGVPCELGGGLRTLEHLQTALAAGVRRVILGSRAAESLDFVAQAVETLGSEAVAVGIDAKDGKVAVRGWVETTGWDALDLARQVVRLGVGTIIYTDVATDGMLTGPNVKAMADMVQALPGTQIIASGGVSAVHDIRALAEVPGLYGVIVGRALYEGRLTVPEAVAAASIEKTG
jgi:phosphoribosylformimino-5-aminoimidazole carboxamide ribotide isomerase